ncbi:hypothetical protein MTQ01_23625 [Streptomyces sp. XM4193]|uniref:hypothetical protein n=1 Tax=Streptomyces sp. XM4193 TaxID=2929782 RepID=UPI001FFAEEC5|nr:hypothetical protein [Streptomyces sp. XM4193]MCK1798963.1 hypothetical protein [Streptomyces sp. XM4193]
MGERRESAEAVRTRIGQAVILHRGGDREEARRRLAELWTELYAGSSALHRSTVAHYLAQTQDEPDVGLVWDLRALAEADTLGAGAPADGEAPAGHPDAASAAEQRAVAQRELREVRSFYPRLHLSLAGAYARLGETAAARRELVRTRSALRALRTDRYAADLRADADRLERALEAGGAAQG